jgi:prepilin-type N-terminal cleavage/methylation domain-containing protein
MSPRLWTKGFTLIELMIVVAIVAILVSIAVPMMKLHYEKAKLTEVTGSMSGAAAAVAAYYQDNYFFPQNAQTSIAMFATTLGVAIPPATLSRISSVNLAANLGTITFVIQNIGSNVDGSSLILSPSTTNEGAVIWSWGASAGFPKSLVPTK